MTSTRDGIFVAGHRGLVGSALVRALRAAGHGELLLRTREELDLRDGAAVRGFFRAERPRVVFLAAARVGGIQANNTRRWDFIHENLAIETNVLGAAVETEVPRLITFGSSCIYPREAPQPLREEYLLTGPLEPTNEPYAIAKIAGVKLVEAAAAQFGHRWISLMPTNLYGPHDNFDEESSHVLPALIAKMHRARISGGQVTAWGDGSPLREFLHADDLALAALKVMDSERVGLYNVGSGVELSIRELAELIASVVGVETELRWDRSRPNGTPRKALDSTRFRDATGWRPTITLRDGIAATYEWFLTHVAPGATQARSTRGLRSAAT